jgi:hypothetical protein
MHGLRVVTGRSDDDRARGGLGRRPPGRAAATAVLLASVAVAGVVLLGVSLAGQGWVGWGWGAWILAAASVLRLVLDGLVCAAARPL